MAFTGIHHLVIRVHDLEESVSHWSSKLGMTLTRTQTNAAMGVNQAIFDLPDGGFIELVSPIDQHSPMAKTLAARGEGVHLVSMSVNSTDDEIAELKASGVTILGDADGPNFVHPKSASGVMLGLAATGKH
ncbi:MAG: VOC family protein [Pseudomonadaceae bacterium]|nr:VOC family protein [Pseudomonadaceae bacterium]